MKRVLATFALVACTFAFADTRIPGTTVSYKVKQDPMFDSNGSMVFVDDPIDKTGKTYAAFVCVDGAPEFRVYSPSTFGSYVGEEINLYVRADKGIVKHGIAAVRRDTKTGRLTSAEIGYGPSLQILSMFLSAKTNVIVRVERNTGSPLTYTFPIKGFLQGYRAINSCE